MSPAADSASGLRELLTGALARRVEAAEAAVRRAEAGAARAEAAAQRAAERAEVVAEEARVEFGKLRAWLKVTSDRGDETAGRLEWISSADEESSAAVLAAVREVGRRVPTEAPLHGSGGLELEIHDAGLGTPVLGFRTSPDGREDGEYVGFEDWFRGSEEVIRARQEVYLPLLADHAPVLDVGCGRGELLTLLRDAGIAARGIDLDPAMVRRCREHGLRDVAQADAVDHLGTLAAGSIGSVFAAQVVEHLPYQSLLSFLRAGRAALAADGVLVMETVNPHSAQALKHFWIDPTHQHPLFPEVLLALCRLTGYAEAFLWFPHGSGTLEHDRVEQPDYTIVARPTLG